MKQIKDWGTTERLTATPLCELHRIHVLPGGYCSIHQHQGRANGFYVVNGSIEIRVWLEDGPKPTEARQLFAGDYYSVGPGFNHQFASPSGAEVLELYYPVLRGEDIQRQSVGGVAP